MDAYQKEFLLREIFPPSLYDLGTFLLSGVAGTTQIQFVKTLVVLSHRRWHGYKKIFGPLRSGPDLEDRHVHSDIIGNFVRHSLILSVYIMVSW